MRKNVFNIKRLAASALVIGSAMLLTTNMGCAANCGKCRTATKKCGGKKCGENCKCPKCAQQKNDGSGSNN